MSLKRALYVLEALANGVPVVQPRHGSSPELIEATEAAFWSIRKILRAPLRQLLQDLPHRDELGRKGKEAVHQRFHAGRMAQETVAIYQEHVR